MAKTFKLTYSSEWTEDDERQLSEALGLSEKQEESLFTKHKAIELSETQYNALQKLNSADDEIKDESEDHPETETPAETKPVVVPDTEHPDEDIVDISIANQRDRDAVDMSVTLSAAFGKIFTGVYEAREKINIAPLLAMQAMKETAKDKGKDLSSLPVPNSRREQGKTVVGTGDNKTILGSNAPWDKYTYQAQNDKGNMVKRQGSYYKSEFDASEVGKNIASELKLVETALMHLKDPATTAMPDRYKGFQSPAMIRRKKLWDSRQSQGYTFLRKTVTLYQQTQAFDNLSKVRYLFDTETVKAKDGTTSEVFINRNEPVTLCNVVMVDGKEREKDHTIYSLVTFTKFNVAEAIATAGGADKVTLAELQKTIARDTSEEEKTDSKDDWSKHEIENVQQIENIFSSIVTFLAVEPGGDVNTKREAAVAKRFGEKDGDEALLVFGDANLAMDNLFTKFADRYNKLNFERAQAKMKEREALAKRNAA